jgi:hypothetical protein
MLEYLKDTVLKFLQEVLQNVVRKYRIILIGVLGGIILLAAVLLLISRLGHKNGAIAVSGAPSPTAVATSLPTPASNPQIMGLEDTLRDNSLSKEAREAVVEKLNMAKRMAAEQAAGASQEKKEKQSPAIAPTAAAQLLQPTVVPDQLFEGSQGMIRPSMAQISNCWQGTRNGSVWEIYAGALANHPEQGALFVFTNNAERMTRAMRIIKGPAKSGLLRILSVDGVNVTLQTADGTKLKFSLKTLKFIK